MIEHSENIFKFFAINSLDIFELMPEFIGMEKEFQEVLDAEKNAFIIPNVFKIPEFYIDIHIHKGKKDTLIILLEDVTERIHIQKKINQERNEKVLLLDEVAEKNRQLKQFNEQMQEMVNVEIKKNLEKQKMLELKSRHAQMGEMIGMITHQWKQPLSVISIMASGLKLKHELDKLNDTIINTFIQKLHTQIAHMNQTINDFQHFFNPVKEKIDFNLQKNLSSALELVQHEYEINNISLELICDEDVFAYGFPNQYNQVILSILSNAKDAFLETPHDAMQIIITINRHDKTYSIVTIKDNAGGIQDTIIDTIFDLYMTTKNTGSGLGLNIAKTIIEENMNGKLHVCNVDNGVEFSIIL